MICECPTKYKQTTVLTWNAHSFDYAEYEMGIDEPARRIETVCNLCGSGSYTEYDENGKVSDQGGWH